VSNHGRDGTQGLLEALHVRRNAALGFAAGAAVTGLIFVWFVVLPADTVRSPLYYVALAFVLATAAGGLVTALLVGARARRLAKDL
jgi:apolipoprotein N-acyltransferase